MTALCERDKVVMGGGGGEGSGSGRERGENRSESVCDVPSAYSEVAGKHRHRTRVFARRCQCEYLSATGRRLGLLRGCGRGACMLSRFL
jgi:hypothetical protein